jgi:hypothetical protein
MNKEAMGTFHCSLFIKQLMRERKRFRRGEKNAIILLGCFRFLRSQAQGKEKKWLRN